MSNIYLIQQKTLLLGTHSGLEICREIHHQRLIINSSTSSRSQLDPLSVAMYILLTRKEGGEGGKKFVSSSIPEVQSAQLAENILCDLATVGELDRVLDNFVYQAIGVALEGANKAHQRRGQVSVGRIVRLESSCQ
ncbi:unnamed protein product [Protopolystoma xenopodis]|uniref:Uncharacterized protein n=1 Tax=Protopolystoma xenopodis TaxID=117903 RepID=A0A448WIB5_9PLAT|nr:unnamed protein product [Protopolystoma xenopodis]